MQLTCNIFLRVKLGVPNKQHVNKTGSKVSINFEGFGNLAESVKENRHRFHCEKLIWTRKIVLVRCKENTSKLKSKPKDILVCAENQNKLCSMPNEISAPVRLSDGPCSLYSDLSDEKFRRTATNPAQIAPVFNKYLASVFTCENLSH